MKILIFGLPGSGKTYLAKKLMDYFGTNQMLEKPTMFVDYVITQKRGDIDIQAIVAQLEKGIAR